MWLKLLSIYMTKIYEDLVILSSLNYKVNMSDNIAVRI